MTQNELFLNESRLEKQDDQLKEELSNLAGINAVQNSEKDKEIESLELKLRQALTEVEIYRAERPRASDAFRRNSNEESSVYYSRTDNEDTPGPIDLDLLKELEREKSELQQELEQKQQDCENLQELNNEEGNQLKLQEQQLLVVQKQNNEISSILVNLDSEVTDKKLIQEQLKKMQADFVTIEQENAVLKAEQLSARDKLTAGEAQLAKLEKELEKKTEQYQYLEKGYFELDNEQQATLKELLRLKEEYSALELSADKAKTENAALVAQVAVLKEQNDGYLSSLSQSIKQLETSDVMKKSDGLQISNGVVNDLSAKLAEQDREISALRQQIATLQREKEDLMSKQQPDGVPMGLETSAATVDLELENENLSRQIKELLSQMSMRESKQYSNTRELTPNPISDESELKAIIEEEFEEIQRLQKYRHSCNVILGEVHVPEFSSQGIIEQLERLGARFEQLDNKFLSIKTLITSLEKSNVSLSRSLRSARDEQLQVDQIASEVHTIQSALKDLSLSLNISQSVSALPEVSTISQSSLNNLKHNLGQIEGVIEQLTGLKQSGSQSSIDELTESLLRVTAERNDYEREKEDYLEQIEQAKADMAGLAADYQRIVEENQELKLTLESSNRQRAADRTLEQLEQEYQNISENDKRKGKEIADLQEELKAKDRLIQVLNDQREDSSSPSGNSSRQASQSVQTTGRSGMQLALLQIERQLVLLLSNLTSAPILQRIEELKEQLLNVEFSLQPVNQKLSLVDEELINLIKSEIHQDLSQFQAKDREFQEILEEQKLANDKLSALQQQIMNLLQSKGAPEAVDVSLCMSQLQEIQEDKDKIIQQLNERLESELAKHDRERDFDAVNKNYQEAQNQIREQEKLVTGLQLEIAEEKEEQQKQTSEYLLLENENDSEASEIAELQQEVSHIREIEDRLEESEGLAAKVKEYELDLTKKKLEISTEAKLVTTLSQEISELEQSMTEKNDEVGKEEIISEELKEQLADYNNLLLVHEALEESFASKQAEVQELEDAKQKALEENERIAENSANLELYEQESEEHIEELEEELMQKQVIMEKEIENLANFEELENENSKESSKLKELETQNEEINHQLSLELVENNELERNVQDISAQLAAEQEYNKALLEKNHENNSILTELETLKSDNSALQSSNKNMKQQLSEASEQTRELSSQKEELEQEVQELTMEAKDREAQLRTLSEQSISPSTITEYKEEIDKLELIIQQQGDKIAEEEKQSAMAASDSEEAEEPDQKDLQIINLLSSENEQYNASEKKELQNSFELESTAEDTQKSGKELSNNNQMKQLFSNEDEIKSILTQILVQSNLHISQLNDIISKFAELHTTIEENHKTESSELDLEFDTLENELESCNSQFEQVYQTISALTTSKDHAIMEELLDEINSKLDGVLSATENSNAIQEIRELIANLNNEQSQVPQSFNDSLQKTALSAQELSLGQQPNNSQPLLFNTEVIDITGMQIKIAQLENELEQLKDTKLANVAIENEEYLKRENQRLEKDLEQTINEYNINERDIIKLKNEISNKQLEIEELNKKNEEFKEILLDNKNLKSEKEMMEKELVNLRSSFQDIRDLIQQHFGDSSDLLVSIENLFECKKENSEKDKQILELEQEITKLNEERKQYRRRAREERDSKDKSEKEVKVLEMKIQREQEELEKYRDDVKEIRQYAQEYASAVEEELRSRLV